MSIAFSELSSICFVRHKPNSSSECEIISVISVLSFFSNISGSNTISRLVKSADFFSFKISLNAGGDILYAEEELVDD